MGKKQITKTIRQKTQRVERLVRLGQPVSKEHIDKYADKYADKSEATKKSYNTTEQKRKKNSTSIAEKHQPERDHQKEILNYRSNITLFSDRAYDSAINGDYCEGLRFIKKLVGLLKSDLFYRLSEIERMDMKNTVYSLENLCLAKATPFLGDQLFDGSMDLIYLADLKDDPLSKHGNRYGISQKETERFYREWG